VGAPEVFAATGPSLSVGGGTNRLVAKLAAERAKPRPGTSGTGVLIVPPGDEAAFLATHVLAEIPGVGPRLQASLHRYGLRTVPEALRVDRVTLESWLGPRTGAWLHGRIRGRGGVGIGSDVGTKSMSHEETFARDLGADDAIETELLRLVNRLCADLRKAGLRARSITVKLRDHDFRTRQASRTLPEPVDVDRAAYAVAVDLLRQLRSRRRVPARLIGVAFSRFESESEPQLDLLAEAESGDEAARDRRVAAVVDRVNRRFGRQALEPARLKSDRRHR